MYCACEYRIEGAALVCVFVDAQTLLALSSLIQNAPAGIAALKEHNGVGLVCGLIVAAEDRKTQVKAMRLLGYLCATPEDCTVRSTLCHSWQPDMLVLV
jgi:hypothetical protein